MRVVPGCCAFRLLHTLMHSFAVFTALSCGYFHLQSPLSSHRHHSCFARLFSVGSVQCATSTRFDFRLPSRPIATGKLMDSLGRLNAIQEAKFRNEREEDRGVIRGEEIMLAMSDV